MGARQKCGVLRDEAERGAQNLGLRSRGEDCGQFVRISCAAAEASDGSSRSGATEQGLIALERRWAERLRGIGVNRDAFLVCASSQHFFKHGKRIIGGEFLLGW